MDSNLAVLCLCVLLGFVQSNPPSLEESMLAENRTSELIKTLLNRMDPRVRPCSAGQAVLVKVDSHVVGLGSIDEVSMDFKVDIYIRLTWRDPRLHYEDREYPRPITFTQGFVQDIWIPDIFVPNERDNGWSTLNNQLRIYPNGTVAHSVRKTLKLICNMDLHYYPLDRQQCFIHLVSFSYDEDQLKLAWHNSHPVTRAGDMRLPDMELETIITHREKKIHQIPGGVFDLLTIEFRIVREYRYFLLQTYIPSVLIVILSWVSFWIDLKAVPARVSLSATAVLTMTAHVSGTKPDSPKVSFAKAIDIWTSICLIFVFLSLIEYACVNALMRSKSPTKDENSNADTPDAQEYGSEGSYKSRPRCLHFANLNKARFLDRISRFVFPISFLLSNIAYWSYYLNPPPYEAHSR